MFATYARALRQLGAEKKLGAALFVANLVLAASQFAEPILFGRVIDALARPRDHAHPLTLPS